MRVVSSYPPNYAEVCAAFNIKGKAGVVFTYGETVYNPSGGSLSPDLLAHEAVHVAQQARYDGGPAAWWERYIESPGFRLEQEVEAYRAQWRYGAENYGRKMRRDLLSHITRVLSGPMYGRIVTAEQAKRLVTDGG